MDPNMDRSKSKKRFKARGNALPTDHQAAILRLEPGKCALRLKSWDHFFDRSAPVFLGLPHALRDLRPDPTLPELLTESFGIIPFIRRNDLETFTRAAPLARVHFARIEQRQHLRTLIPIGWCGAVRQGHAPPLGEAVDEDPLAFPPVGGALAAPPPPSPGGKSAINGAILPMNHPAFLGHPQNPRLHCGQRALRLPPLQPAMRGALRRSEEHTSE